MTSKGAARVLVSTVISRNFVFGGGIFFYIGTSCTQYPSNAIVWWYSVRLGWSSWLLGWGGGDGRPTTGTCTAAATSPPVSLHARSVDDLFLTQLVWKWSSMRFLKNTPFFLYSIVRKRKKHGKQQQTSSTEWSDFSIYCSPPHVQSIASHEIN